MQDSITLEKFIPIADSGPYAGFLAGSFQEVYLPTEAFVCTPTFVTPQTARVYNTRLFLINNRLYTYEEALELFGKDFKGTAYLDQVYWWEVWFDQGNDGRVLYQHAGYVALTNTVPVDKQYPTTFIDNLCWGK